MKKLLCVFLAVILVFAFVGCSNDSSYEQTKSADTSSQSEQVIVAEKESTEQSKTTASTGETTRESEKVTQKDTTNKNTTKKNSATKKNDKTSQRVTSTKASSTKSTAKPTTTKKAKTTVPSTVTCTLSVECKEILANMSDLKEGHEALIPSNGVIIESTYVTVKNGSTAYDVLKSICDDRGIPLNATTSGYGRYIVGIGNIDEKDCGAQSGWTYTVNGKSIWKSCDKYTVSKGESIEFHYVCKY